jgi:hypothetical protein
VQEKSQKSSYSSVSREDYAAKLGALIVQGDAIALFEQQYVCDIKIKRKVATRRI